MIRGFFPGRAHAAGQPLRAAVLFGALVMLGACGDQLERLGYGIGRGLAAGSAPPVPVGYSPPAPAVDPAGNIQSAPAPSYAPAPDADPSGQSKSPLDLPQLPK